MSLAPASASMRMSAPAAKTFAAPDRTMQLTAGSASALWKASRMPVSIAGESALRVSGSSRVTSASRPRRSTVTGSEVKSVVQQQALEIAAEDRRGVDVIEAEAADRLDLPTRIRHRPIGGEDDPLGAVALDDLAQPTRFERAGPGGPGGVDVDRRTGDHPFRLVEQLVAAEVAGDHVEPRQVPDQV